MQRLGNLTLVTGKLNPALSHRPWTKPDGPGKRDFLLQHSTLKLNAQIVAAYPTAWTDQDIDERTQQLAARVIALWPRPAGAPATPIDPKSVEPVVEVPVGEVSIDQAIPENGKYRSLWRWLSAQEVDEIRLTFADVEEILQMPLPPSARSYLPHWYGYDGTALGRAIRNAGWTASQVNLTDERVFSCGPMASASVEAAPEVGQLVRVRGQHWVVTDVHRSRLPEDELAAVRPAGRTLVSLASADTETCVRLPSEASRSHCCWNESRTTRPTAASHRVRGQAGVPTLLAGRPPPGRRVDACEGPRGRPPDGPGRQRQSDGLRHDHEHGPPHTPAESGGGPWLAGPRAGGVRLRRRPSPVPRRAARRSCGRPG